MLKAVWFRGLEFRVWLRFWNILSVHGHAAEIDIQEVCVALVSTR